MFVVNVFPRQSHSLFNLLSYSRFPAQDVSSFVSISVALLDWRKTFAFISSFIYIAAFLSSFWNDSKASLFLLYRWKSAFGPLAKGAADIRKFPHQSNKNPIQFVMLSFYVQIIILKVFETILKVRQNEPFSTGLKNQSDFSCVSVVWKRCNHHSYH